MQLKWWYLQRTAPRVGTLMGPIEEALRETLLPTLFEGDDIDTDFWRILGHRIYRDGLGIPDLRLSAESAYITSKAASRKLVGSILGGNALNYVGHRACVRRASLGVRSERKYVKMSDMARRNDLSRFQ